MCNISIPNELNPRNTAAKGPVTALTAVAIGACEQNWRLGICIFADMAQELKERRSVLVFLLGDVGSFFLWI